MNLFLSGDYWNGKRKRGLFLKEIFQLKTYQVCWYQWLIPGKKVYLVKYGNGGRERGGTRNRYCEIKKL